MCRVGKHHTFLGIYGVHTAFEFTIHTVIYGANIRFWPILVECGTWKCQVGVHALGVGRLSCLTFLWTMNCRARQHMYAWHATSLSCWHRCKNTCMRGMPPLCPAYTDERTTCMRGMSHLCPAYTDARTHACVACHLFVLLTQMQEKEKKVCRQWKPHPTLIKE